MEILRGLALFFYELLGFRWVWEHIRPPAEKEKKGEWRPAPTFTIWVFGVYTALFGLASARYEHAVDRVEIRAGAVVALLANDKIRSDATAQVALIQKRRVPKRPEYWPPFFDSFWKREPYQEGIELLKTAVESCKKELGGANLSGAILLNAKLEGANLHEADLRDAILQNADLKGAQLQLVKLLRADLQEADLQGADLPRAEMQMTNLRQAKLQRAQLQRANLQGSQLQGTFLQGAFLQEANLQDIQGWKEIRSIQGADITGVRNAPTGFVDWALNNGAVINGE